MGLIFESTFELISCVTQDELKAIEGAKKLLTRAEKEGYKFEIECEGEDGLIPWQAVPETVLIEYAQGFWSDLAHEYLMSINHKSYSEH